MNFIEELKWRGMLHDVMPGIEELLSKQVTRGYIGFDPTADSLHVGHLTQIMTLIHFSVRVINQWLWWRCHWYGWRSIG